MRSRINEEQYCIQLQDVASFLYSKNDFLVVSHIHPDGDAISSTYAMGLLLEKLSKRYILVNEHRIPNKFEFLKNHQNISSSLNWNTLGTFKHVITVDCADLSRIGKATELFSANYDLLNIDHHHTNDFFGSTHLINSDAAATVQIIFDLVQYMGIQLDINFYNCIYTGLTTDTGGFRYSNTSSKVLEIAMDLIERGVNSSFISHQVLDRLSKSQILLLQRTLPSLNFSDEGRIAWMTVTSDDISITQASFEDLEGLVQYPRNIEGVEVGLLFKEMEPQVFKVSLRSQQSVDVSKIAKVFGGGGHIRAAGCVLVGDVNEVISKVLEESRKEIT